MTHNDYFDEEAIAIGLSADDIQAVARRQFVASVAVAVVIAVGAGLAAFMPVSQNIAATPSHTIAVRQPTFATPPGHNLASAKPYAIELP